MVPFDRFAVVLDACTMFPMLVRDVLLTFAAHELFSPKWSPRIREEWTRNLIARMTERDGEDEARSKVARIAVAVESAAVGRTTAAGHRNSARGRRNRAAGAQSGRAPVPATLAISRAAALLTDRLNECSLICARVAGGCIAQSEGIQRLQEDSGLHGIRWCSIAGCARSLCHRSRQPSRDDPPTSACCHSQIPD